MEKMRHLTVRISLADFNKIAEIACERGLIFSEATREIIRTGCSKMKSEETTEKQTEILAKLQIIESTLASASVTDIITYIHDLLRFVVKIDMILHEGLIKQRYTSKDEIAKFYEPILRELGDRGFQKPLSGRRTTDEK